MHAQRHRENLWAVKREKENYDQIMNPAVLRNGGIFVQGAKRRKKTRPTALEL